EGGGKSEGWVVPRKRGNCPEGPGGGKRAPEHTGSLEGKMAETSGSITVSTKLERIAKQARSIERKRVGDGVLYLRLHLAKPWAEEPDAGNPHVRIRGSPGQQSPGRPDSSPYWLRFIFHPGGSGGRHLVARARTARASRTGRDACPTV